MSESRPNSVSRAPAARVVAKEGWLMKTGNGSLTKSLYKKRWCILYGGSFSYMKKKEDSEPKGHIFLSSKTSIGRTNDKRHPFTFEIRPAAGERVFRMQALDEDDRDDWLRELASVRGVTRFDTTEVPEADYMSYDGSSPGRSSSTGSRKPSASGIVETSPRHGRSASQPEPGLASTPRISSSAAIKIGLVEGKQRAKSPSQDLRGEGRPKSPSRRGISPSRTDMKVEQFHHFSCETSGHRFQDGGTVIFCSACGEQKPKIAVGETKTPIMPESTHFSRLAELGTFTFTSKEAVGFEIPPAVPANARYVLISYFLLCGLEYEKDGPSRIFRVRLWTTGGHVMWKMGARYPQSVLSFDSDNLWFPLGPTDRRLFVQCDDVQTINCRAIELFVAGYR